MKTKEEIEQLAKQLCNIPIDLVIDEEERYYKNFQKYDGIIQGYTQCQEDMTEKKYTEEDLKKAFKFYAYAHISQQPHSYEKLEQDYLQFIKSLIIQNKAQ